MRNGENVVKTAKSLKTPDQNSTTSSSLLPEKNVFGLCTVLERPGHVKSGHEYKLVRAILLKYFHGDLNEPVVVLATKQNDAKNIYADLKKHLDDTQRKLIYFPDNFTIEENDPENKKLKDDVEEFLTLHKGILITDVHSFSGAQARNVIVNAHGSLSSAQNAMYRTTANMYLILDKKSSKKFKPESGSAFQREGDDIIDYIQEWKQSDKS